MTFSSSRPTDPIGDITAERDAVLDELARRSAGDPESAELCGYAGELSHRLYLLRDDDGRDEELALAVEAFEHAFRNPGAEPLWSAWRVRFGQLRGVQYEDGGERHVLEEAFALLVAGVEGLPDQDPDFAWERVWGRQVLAVCAKLRCLAEPDSAELLAEALRRHDDALADVEPGSEEEADLRAGAGYLSMQRALLHGDLDAADTSARHYRALLDTAAPAEVPHLRYSLGLAAMVRGRVRVDREELEAARDAFDTALTEARRAGGPEPHWAFEAEVNALLVRAMIWGTWKDVGHSLAAEVELRRLLERPGAEEQLLPQYLDMFGRLLYERAAARDDAEGRDRGISLVRRALDTWRPERDGDIGATALFLALFQQSRHHDDPRPDRARDVLRAAGIVLDSGTDNHDLLQSARMLDGWARFTLADHGELPEIDGYPEGLDAERLKQTWDGMLDDIREGRAFVDFGEEEFLRGMERDVVGSRRRIQGFEQALARLRALEPGSPGRAQLASLILNNLTLVDPEGTHVTAEHRRELTQAVLERAERDPAWRGPAHAIAGVARLQEEMISGSGAGFDEVLAHFDRAEADGGLGDEADYGLALARFVAQTQRGQTGGAGDDMEAGAATWRRLRSDPALPAHVRRLMELQQAGFDAHAAVRSGDLATADRHIAALTEGHAALSDEDPSRIEILILLENARLGRDNLAQHLGVPPLPPLAARPGPAELRRQASRLPRDHRAWVLGDTGMARFAQAAAQQDGPGLVAAIGLLREAHELCEPGSDSRLRYANGLGIAHCVLSEMEFDRVRRRERLAKGIALLEGAFAEAGGPEHRLYADIGLALARAHRTRDDLHRRDRASARSLGLKSLRGHAWAALLQSGTDHATVAAAQATGAALEVAGWCLKDDRPEEALQALDACRGLVLHATLTSATVPDLLTATGHTGLAADWQAAGAGATERPSDPLTAAQTPLTVPSTLRRRVLAALTGTHQAQLLDPPTPDEIAEALRTLTKDALVYLVPATDDTPGTALVVTSKATVHAVPLPTLTEDAAPLKEYGPGEGLSRAGGPDSGAAQAQYASGAGLSGGPGDPPTEYGPGGGLAHDATGAPAHPHPRDLGPVPGWRPTAPSSLRAQLDRLCGWAWYAAMRPLLEAFEMPAGRLPRLVLVPMGKLGLVPWHAAWEAGGPRGRQYALQAAEISYAASARLLCQVAARPAAEHTGAALIVGNPTGDLRHAGEEADAVQRAFYPDARFLGRRTAGPTDGPGTPGEVLRWLRETPYDGAVLHLACHASVAENARRSAYLALHDGQLAAEEIAGAGGDRLGLVLLAACRSHVSGRGHNEAYSLATAFLAAGARSVVGSLWPVPDEATSVLMFLTHHFLRTHGEPPARALRRAQLWMLNPDRELPPELPEFLAERARRIDPHDLSAWAGFTHLGR
ncbi:CHAT domain-containing protein [Streptomyces diastatochromogenes]|uniref:CHAT domain-containing protein n=1 Tax=Streptomyces diastatochromogenes TaxID=42236 RepID=A0A233SRN3_STRDA|nr:CHAT domain-containing protein [Streptomyces diastatochromogenes]OXY98305.1 CHAT domain-containing protein [Streptomyces diastatochromogenes]